VEAVAPLPEVIVIESQARVLPRAEAMPSAKGKRLRESPVIRVALLLAITALGGVLRFICLDRPAIWGDEAATFMRVSGTYYQLMDRLQSAGFAPLHYELYWWIGQHALLTPFMMRLVPAIAGTLMIPAMYWLAAQLIGHRAALLTALLTATSAYLLNYSRDAKMYSPFWLLAVLNVASLLWWLRVRTPTSWCVWLTTGTAMVGVHALGWIIVVIELLFVLTSRRGNWLSLPRLALLLFSSIVVWSLSIGVFVAGIFIAAHGLGGRPRTIALTIIALAVLRPLWLTISFVLNRRRSRQIHATDPAAATAGSSPWIARIFSRPTERTFFRPWIARRTAAFRWPPMALFLFGLIIMAAGPVGYYLDFNQYLSRVQQGWNGTGIEWVDIYNLGRTGPGLVECTASAFLASWEWPREADTPRIAPRTLRLLTSGVLSIAATLALGLLPFPGSRSLQPAPALGGWRSALWLTLWLVLPPYGFYCVSIKNHVGPGSWIIATKDFFHSSPWWLTAIAILIALAWIWIAGRSWRERCIRVLQFVGIGAAGLLAIEAFYLIYPLVDAALSARSEGWQEHGSVWISRYVAVVLPAVFIIASALLFRLPTRPLRWAAVSLFVVVNLSVHAARVFAGSEQPTDLLAHDIIDAQKSDRTDGPFRAYFESSMISGGAEPGSISVRSPAIRYYITIFSPRGTPLNEPDDSQLQYRIRPPRGTWMSFTGYIINEVRRSPGLRTFVTWERIDPREIDLTDKILQALQPDWRLASEQNFAVRDHWRWIDTATLRRRVYVRTSAGE
jgi:hypothetical protein